MKKSLMIGALLALSGSASAQIAISEVYEANGGTVKYVELHNLTNQAIMFNNDWFLTKTTNGNGPGTGTDYLLVGTLPANGFFVIGDASVDTIFGMGTLDQTESGISHNGDDEYVLSNGMNVVDSFAGDRIGNDDPFAANVVAFRVMSQYPNDGSWDADVTRGGNGTSPSGFWTTVDITSSNGNALAVATPGSAGGAGGTELPVTLQSFSVE